MRALISIALGATLYNLLTGVIPPDAPTRVADESLVPPSRFQPHISPAMERIVLKALHVRPNDRFQSAEEMQRALYALERPKPKLPVLWHAQSGRWFSDRGAGSDWYVGQSEQ